MLEKSIDFFPSTHLSKVDESIYVTYFQEKKKKKNHTKLIFNLDEFPSTKIMLGEVRRFCLPVAFKTSLTVTCLVNLRFRVKKQATWLNLVTSASQKYAYCHI